MKLSIIRNQFKKPAFLVILLALVLRLPLLDGSFWLDEAAQALESARPFSAQLEIIPDFQPPLMHYLLHFAMFISRSEWWLRLVGAVIPGLITLAATHRLALKMFGKTSALLTSLLIASSSFHIFFSQELRPYSLAAMWAALSFTYLYELIDRGSIEQQPRNFVRSWLPLTLINLLGLYSSYLYPFVVVSQFLVIVLLGKDQLVSCLKSAAISAIGFLPFLPIFLQQLAAGQQLRSTIPGWELVVSHPQLQALPLTLGKFIFGVIRLEVNQVFVGISLLIASITLILAAFAYQQHKKSQLTLKPWIFSLILLLSSLLIPWIVSFWIPVIQPKRLMFLQPLVYLIMVGLVTQSWDKLTVLAKSMAVILFITLFSINVFSTAQYYLSPELQREDWRALVAYTQARLPNHQTIAVFGFDEPFAPWRWYAGDHFETLSPGKKMPDDFVEVQEAIKPIYNFQFVLLFDYLRDLTDPQNHLLQAVESFGYEEFEVLDYPGIGFIRIYVRDKELLISSLR